MVVPNAENRIKTIFDHFRNTHARFFPELVYPRIKNRYFRDKNHLASELSPEILFCLEMQSLRFLRNTSTDMDNQSHSRKFEFRMKSLILLVIRITSFLVSWGYNGKDNICS